MSIPTTQSTPHLEALLTARDLEILCAGKERFELVEGRVREMSPTSSEHGRVTKRLDQALTSFIYSHELGECFTAEAGFTIRREPDTILAPDWAFVRNDRLPTPFPEKGFWVLSPDIVLETRSPSDISRWVEEKTTLWLEAGTGVVMNLDPQRRRLTVHRSGSDPVSYGPDDTLELDELPGLRVPLRATLRW